MTTDTEAILSELRRIAEKVDALAVRSPSTDPIVSRSEAAAMLKVSRRQLHRLIAAGRLAAMPSGIARAELERYAKTPQAPLPKAMTKPMRERTAKEEAERGRALLRAASKAERGARR